MKSTRYSSYQPLLKALAQAAIADRPQGWTDGELFLGHEGSVLVCRLRHPEQGVEQGASARVESAANTLAQALARDGLPWVGCRIGFFRKPVGWGVRVHITPSHGSPELDLTPERAPSAVNPQQMPHGVEKDGSPGAAEPLAAPVGRSTLPGLDDPFALQPLSRGGHGPALQALPEGDALPPPARPLPPDPVEVAPLRLCPHCRQHSLRFMLRDEGTDHYQCEHCGYKLTMVAPDFGDVPYHVKPQSVENEGPHSANPVLQPDGRITGPDYAMHLSSPETLMYQSGNMQVPVRVVQDVARGLRVLEAERLSTVDTPFGARMLTPKEHASILQHLRQAVHLLPGRYLVE